MHKITSNGKEVRKIGRDERLTYTNPPPFNMGRDLRFPVYTIVKDRQRVFSAEKERLLRVTKKKKVHRRRIFICEASNITEFALNQRDFLERSGVTGSVAWRPCVSC